MLISTQETLIYKSISPEDIYCYTPGITVTSTGRLVVTFDLGGKGVKEIYASSQLYTERTRRLGIGKIFVSDDQGASWCFISDFNFWHARPFCIGEKIYIIGNAGDLCIICSEDDGNTWSVPSFLSQGEKWHSSACNVLFANERVYLAMEQRFYNSEIEGWNVAGLSPTLQSCYIHDDLLDASSWRRSDPFVFRDKVHFPEGVGIPFYESLTNKPLELAPGRFNAPTGWLEAQVVQIKDKHHIWYDPEGKTFHMFLRAHTGGIGYACLLKVREDKNGQMVTGFQETPSGQTLLFLPFPGGHLKFFIVYDEISRLYWMASNQSFDSMRTISSLPETSRYGLPNNERHRLQLLFSKNCVDWCMAGMIACQGNELYSRNYPSLCIVGEDMHVVCRAADDHTKDPQYSDCITYYKIKRFRMLIY